jgi:sialic acid synthase
MEIQINESITIGDGHPVFVIAEIGNNHNGDMKIAKELVDAASHAGVSAVKFQTKDIETAFSQDLLNKPYNGPNSFGATYREHKNAIEFNSTQHKEIFEYSNKQGLVPFSTPFDIKSMELLENLNVPLYKISSFHVTDEPLLKAVCETRKPLIMSTGMSTWEELDKAVNQVLSYHDKLILLHCVSSYPTDDEDVNLSNITALKSRFGCLVGYSGHERGITICTASIPLGACVIERHFTLDRTMKGPDHAASVEPQGMELIVKHSKQISKALGKPRVDVLESELKNRKKFRGY